MVALRMGIGPFLSGVIFALGLGIGGMTEAANILGFLDLGGNWKPDLIFVMLGALVVYGVLSRLILKQRKPLMMNQFHLPSESRVGRELILGALIFGVGWGVTGLCPGPAVVTLVSGNLGSLVFVSAMLFGMFTAKRLTRPTQSSSRGDSAI